MDLFIALAIITVKISPLAPTSDPATIRTLFNNNKPAKAAAIPEKELSKEITKLNELRQSGVLTEEEFDKAKKKLLNN